MDLVKWLTDEQLELIYTSKYWNDIKAEQQKEWWISDGRYEKCMEYLKSTRLLEEYSEAEVQIKNLGARNLEVGDFAAGIGWTSALLSRLECVKTVHAVEISKHRIGGLFEHSVTMLEGNPTKLKRYLGSFYETKFDNESLDVILICHAFHHADNPMKLLAECRRVLKSNGVLLIVGEHLIGVKEVVRRFLSCAINERKIRTNFSELFPTEPILGDHYYKIADYRAMFKASGMTGKLVRAHSGNAMYVVRKS